MSDRKPTIGSAEIENFTRADAARRLPAHNDRVQDSELRCLSMRGFRGGPAPPEERPEPRHRFFRHQVEHLQGTLVALIARLLLDSASAHCERSEKASSAFRLAGGGAALAFGGTGVAEPRGSVPERSAIEKERAWTAPSIAPELIFTQNRTKLQKLGIPVIRCHPVSIASILATIRNVLGS